MPLLQQASGQGMLSKGTLFNWIERQALSYPVSCLHATRPAHISTVDDTNSRGQQWSKESDEDNGMEMRETKAEESRYPVTKCSSLTTVTVSSSKLSNPIWRRAKDTADKPVSVEL